MNSCNLKELKLPKNLQELEAGAFAGCVNLRFSFVDSKNFYSDGNAIYNKEQTEILSYPSAAVHVIIPDHIQKIREYTFANCSKLIKIVFPASINIGNYAFFECENLEEVIFSTSEKTADSVTEEK